jgi:hypothetical protein
MRIKLGSGTVVEVADEYGTRQSLKAAELADVPADMRQADAMLLNIASVFVAVKSVTPKPTEAEPEPKPKSVNDIIGDAVTSKEILLSFRDAFTDPEWNQLTKATNEIYADPKLLVEFEILS